MAVYDEREEIKQTFWQKVFGLKVKANYVIEAENLLHRGEGDVLSIKKADFDALKAKYKIKEGDFEEERKRLFDIYFDYCLLDKQLTNDEKARLEHLRVLLDLDESFVAGRIAQRGEEIYRDNVLEVIADDKVTDEEKEMLVGLRRQFDMPDMTGRDILAEECRKKVQALVDSFVEARRMSPDDENKLKELESGLGVKLKYTDNGLDKLRHFWDIENAPLVPLASPVNLQRGEELYYRTNIKWYETRTRTTYVSYGGLSTSFRIMKGVTLRSGMIAPSRHSEEYMKLIDSGEVFLTNKRIIFMGEAGNKSIAWSKVLSITPYRDGIEIGKDTGRKPFLGCDDVEEMGLFITRLMTDY